MRVAFDTSVLVPALVRAHPRHARAHVWLDAARTGSIVGVASWHAFAESWAVFTRLPLVPRLSGGLAKRMLHRLQSFFDLVEPSAEVYEAAVARCVERGRTSGAVFDALHQRSDLLIVGELWLSQKIAQANHVVVTVVGLVLIFEDKLGSLYHVVLQRRQVHLLRLDLAPG